MLTKTNWSHIQVSPDVEVSPAWVYPQQLERKQALRCSCGAFAVSGMSRCFTCDSSRLDLTVYRVLEVE